MVSSLVVLVHRARLPIRIFTLATATRILAPHRSTPVPNSVHPPRAPTSRRFTVPYRSFLNAWRDFGPPHTLLITHPSKGYFVTPVALVSVNITRHPTLALSPRPPSGWTGDAAAAIVHPHNTLPIPPSWAGVCHHLPLKRPDVLPKSSRSTLMSRQPPNHLTLPRH